MIPESALFNYLLDLDRWGNVCVSGLCNSRFCFSRRVVVEGVHVCKRGGGWGVGGGRRYSTTCWTWSGGGACGGRVYEQMGGTVMVAHVC